MNKNGKITPLRFALIGFFAGFGLVLLAWIVSYLFNSSISFRTVHQYDFPGIIIFELIPFVFAFIFYWFFKTFDKEKARLEQIIEEMNETIKRNLELAKLIGEGNLDVEIEVPQNDELGRALLMMRDNLKATYQREAEYNWITRGKEIVSDILRYQDNLQALTKETIISIVNYVDALIGIFYIYDKDQDLIIPYATYAYKRDRVPPKSSATFKIGEGLVGEAAYEKAIIYRKEIPENYHLTITSGLLGEKRPKTLLISPLIGNEELQGLIEIGSFEEDLPERVIRFFEEISPIIGQTVFNIKVNETTRRLLELARQKEQELRKREAELQKQTLELRQTTEELTKTQAELKARMDELERARLRLYALLENASEVIFIYNEDGIITYVSPSVKRILGFEADDLVGRNGFEVFSPEVNEKLKQAFITLLNNPSETITLEYLFKKEGDKEMWLETIGRNLLDNAAINGIIFNTRDITVRKIAERAQRMSGQMRALSENSPDLIMRVSLDGKIYYANPVAEEFLRVGRRYLVGNYLDKIDIHPDIKNIFKTALNKIIETQKKFQFETVFPIKDSEEERIVILNVIPEFNELNELETVLFVAHDITEHKRILLELEKKNKSISESINYARRIQSAIIPDIKKIRAYLPKSFMFYLPRDVVSGDIPWFYADERYIYIAAVDCTGHGVPGALLSFIAYFLLNNIVSTQPELNAAQILDKLHYEVRKTLKQDTEDAEARDGMDIAFCKIDYKNKKLHFAGAHRPLYYLRNDGEFFQFKATLKAVGGIPRKGRIEKPFINHEIDFNPGDKFFIFTDGLADQIGGPHGRKYKNKRIREIIQQHKDASIFEFYEIFKNDFYQWKGDNKQIDDVLLIGFEL